ncbi:MAG: DNA topoisomerase IB [Parvibaculaceae bacterium]
MLEASERRLLKRLKLKKIETDDLELTRVPHGTGFAIRDAAGNAVSDPIVKARISEIVIPPAWREVRIAAEPEAHLQAVGRDEAGRLQYIYHPDWEHIRSARKIARLKELGDALPGLRKGLRGHLGDRHLSRPSIIAAAVTLIDRAALRAGHEAYAGDEGGRGAATLLKRHATVEGKRINLDFRGKGGKHIVKAIDDARLARRIGMLKDVPGRRLFKEREGRIAKPVTAEDLNAYLREATGADVTAKDFRTFRASAHALELLCAFPPASATERRKALATICREVSGLLDNTPAVCRSSYIHATILDAFEEESLAASLVGSRPRAGLTRAETALMRFLEAQEP